MHNKLKDAMRRQLLLVAGSSDEGVYNLDLQCESMISSQMLPVGLATDSE